MFIHSKKIKAGHGALSRWSKEEIEGSRENVGMWEGLMTLEALTIRGVSDEVWCGFLRICAHIPYCTVFLLPAHVRSFLAQCSVGSCGLGRTHFDRIG